MNSDASNLFIRSPTTYDLRFEVKFAVEECYSSELNSWVALHPARMRRAYPERWVNSLYFDDLDLRCLAENYAGISHRMKARFRWYGNLEVPETGTLEFKIRCNGLGRKIMFPLDQPEIRHGMRASKFTRKLWDAFDPGAESVANRFSQPIVLIRYLRGYYESFDKKIRLTLDKHLTCYNQRDGSQLNFQKPSATLARKFAILEAKASSEHQSELSYALINIPARRSRFSKYVWAVNQP